jgi:hypothetical protein
MKCRADLSSLFVREGEQIRVPILNIFCDSTKQKWMISASKSEKCSSGKFVSTKLRAQTR